MTDAATKNVLRESEAAAYLGVSARTLRRWRDSGLVRFARLSPRVVVYRQIDLEEFVSTRATAPVVVPMTR